MGRRKVALTAEEQEERRERERQRSRSRRRLQQSQPIAEATSDPTIRIVQAQGGEEDIIRETAIRQDAIQDIDSPPGSGGPRSPATCDATLDALEEDHSGQPTEGRSLKNQFSSTDEATKEVGSGGTKKEESGTSPGPSCSASANQRYNLRERRSATPPTATAQKADLATEATSQNHTIHSKRSISLPLRPVPKSPTGGDSPCDGEEPEVLGRPAPTRAQSTSSTRRVRHHRVQQRIVRRQQILHEAHEQDSQVRVLSNPADEPVAESTRETLPTGADPHDPLEEDTTAAAAHAADDTLVRSVIVVSTDESGCLSTTASGAEDDASSRNGASAGNASPRVGNTADEEPADERDESGLFVSDESWDFDLDGNGPDTSATHGEPRPAPVQPQHTSTLHTSAPWFAPDPLQEIMAAIESAETSTSRDFRSRQAEAYRRVFLETLSPGCDCQTSHPESIHVDQDGFSIQEMTNWVRNRLGPMQELWAPTRPSAQDQGEQSPGRQWQALLAQPPASLSLSKSECDPPKYGIQITRAWDVDSIWLGATSLAALRPDNHSFRLSFHPPYTRSIAGHQIIQPHGVDVGHTRHTLLGSFWAGGTAMDVFVFFPNTNDGKPIKPQQARRQRAAKSPYTLSLERQQDLVDGAILPAVQSSLPALFRQEMPPTFAIAHAKCKSYQEKPATHRWSAEDSARAAHLRYTIPGPYLGAFWQAFQARCAQIRIPVANGTSTFAYYQNPQLLFQVHDTKNTFAQPTLGQSLDLFVSNVMQALNPSFLDFRSCWLDIGFRDLATASTADGRSETPVTLLWKRKCLEKFHASIQEVSPDMGLQSEYFRTYHLRDAATYNAKVRGAAGHMPRPSDPGHPNCTKLGVIRAKAYDCDKERFSVINSDYRLFAAPSLAALALTDAMMQDVFMAGHGRANAVTGAPQRKKLEAAWEANKRHLRAVSEHHSPTSGYAARKEITFRLDVILTMLHHGEFARGDQSANLDTVVLGGVSPTQRRDSEHNPFWLVPTADVNSFVCTVACRFVKPLNYIFAMGDGKDETTSLTKQGARSLVYFYTAELFLRLLGSSLTSDRDYFADKWIWESQWTSKQVKDGRRVQYTRRGLGLREAVRDHGLLWLGADQLDWLHGHMSIPELLQLYIPRNPQHPQWAAQSSIRAFGCTNVSAAYVMEDLVLKAAHIRRHDRSSLHVAMAHERTAVHIAAQEVAREYGLHMLNKLLLYWRKAYGAHSQLRRDYPRGPHSLAAALDGLQCPVGRTLTPHTLLDILDEAWQIRQLAEGEPEYNGAEDFPADLPNWMAKRTPKEQLWTRVVFCTLFETASKVTWAGNAFRLFYQRLRDLYNTARHPDAAPFGDAFRDTIGRYITVMFNPDRSKEINVSHGAGYRYSHLPPFFRIQFWAPLINPFRYKADTFQIKQPAFPLSEKGKITHHSLQLRNTDLVHNFRAVRGLSVTTSWVARQPPGTILRLASDLQKCLASLLRLAGPRHLTSASSQSHSYWNFRSPDSVDLQLWEVPVESGSAYAGTMPTVILPTAPVLRFLRCASQAAMNALPLLSETSTSQVRDELSRLKYWLDAVGPLLDDTSSRRTLFSARIALLEETKSLHEDSGHDGLLFQFLDQVEAPQTYTFLDAEGPLDDSEAEVTVYSSSERDRNSDSDSAYTE